VRVFFFQLIHAIIHVTCYSMLIHIHYLAILNTDVLQPLGRKYSLSGR